MDTLETLTIRRGCVSSIIDILKTSPVGEKEQNLKKIKKEMSINMTYSAIIVMNKLKEMLKVIDHEINQHQNKQKLDDTLAMIEKEMKIKGLHKNRIPAPGASTTPTSITAPHHAKTFAKLGKQVPADMAKNASAKKMSPKKLSLKKSSPMKSRPNTMSHITRHAVSETIQAEFPYYLNSVTIKLVKNSKNVIDLQPDQKINTTKVNQRYNTQTTQPLSNPPPVQSDDHRRITRGLLEDRQFIKLRANTFNTDQERVVKSKHMFMEALQLRPTI